MSIRVMQLAKELGMDKMELISKLNEIGIDAKTPAKPLNDNEVAKAREAFGQKKSVSDKDAKKASGKKGSKKASAASSKEAEERARRIEAAKAEYAAREKARAQRGDDSLLGSNIELTDKKLSTLGSTTSAATAPAEKKTDADAATSDKKTTKTAEADSKKGAKAKGAKADSKSKTKKSSTAKTTLSASDGQGQLGDLLSQIEDAEQRQAVEKKIREATKRAADLAAGAEKQMAVERALKSKGAGKAAPAEKSPEPEKKPAAKKVLSAEFKDEKTKKQLGSLLSQINQEKERIKEAGGSFEQAGKGKKKRQPSKKRGKGKKFDSSILDVKPVVSKEDRYAQMAAAAEKLQRDKVLEEARAAVAAATHEGEGRRKRRKEKREAEAREKAELEAIEKGLDPELVLDKSVAEIKEGASVAEFAEALDVPPNDIIKRLFMLGQALTLTQTMSNDLIELIADDLDRKIRIVTPEEEFKVVFNDTEKDLKPRPPVVTVMGHVDHGKTSLLDAIRDTAVIEQESGGITQHIGASVVFKNDRQIAFIDTPGHEAFTAMRARGADVTDVIVLVVAADDGVMPQTIEAINHAKAADVPVIVAVNKIDKPGANPDRVKQELIEYGIIPEELGGKNMFVEISAKKRINIDEMLETILLQADVLELKANPDALATGFVIEANLDKGRGPVATVLVQRGTLHPGDMVVAGTSYGKVRALIGPYGKMYQGVEPGEPAEVLGLDSVPTAGDDFRVFADDREARKLAESRRLRQRLAAQQKSSHMSLEDLFDSLEDGKQTDLNLIVKADVQGSIEALRDAFDKMDQSEVKINVVHSAVGGITETDVTLAAASNAIIIGFNVRPTGKSKQMAEHEKIDIRTYKVIYQVIEDINAARVGLLSPDIVEKDTGTLEVRDTFKVPKVGTIAGAYVKEGEISRNDKVRIVRDGTVVYDGKIGSLKRFKDDVKTVKEGYECGIGIDGYQDIKVGDMIEGYRIEEIERTE